MLVVLFFCLCIYFSVGTKLVTKVERVNGGVNVYAFKDSDSNGDWICRAFYNNTYNTTGWDTLLVQTDPSCSGFLHGECAGLVEGIATYQAIYIHYLNNVKGLCKNQKKLCRKIKRFVTKNVEWMKKMTLKKAATDPYWAQVEVLWGHMLGLLQGYNAGQTDPDKKLTISDILIMNMLDDLEDVAAALTNDTSAKVRGDTRCSALVKLPHNNTDLLVGHNTWTSYTQMYRMVKKYDMPINTTDSSNEPVPGWSATYSGYPGVITSGDDYYVLSNGLVALETTIGNSNSSLWSFVKPHGQVLESARSMIAMRLATNGSSWCKTFSKYNSGTYNNQWMIVDFNNFQKGHSQSKNLLWVLEQIPGYIHYEDMTQKLTDQGYWASYNVAYNVTIFNMSGNQDLVDKYGDWFSYNKTPRALIFKRDSHTVKDIDSMMRLLRSNNYTKDPYSACNCTPPYSAENAIAARSDLNPKNGSYPFPALSHRPHGAIDAKVTSAALVQNMTFVAVCGPTTGGDARLPVFDWESSDFDDTIPHAGQPNNFTFGPFMPVWNKNQDTLC